MTEPNMATEPAASVPQVAPPDYSMIILDRSRPYSTVHGDRQPHDPHYKVHYWQGRLPFDANGRLIPPTPEDEDRGTFRGPDADGNTVTFHPLYSDEARKVLAAKMKRVRSLTSEPEPVTAESEREEQERASDEVNLVAWLQGTVNYEPFLIYAACKKRFGRNFTRLSSVVDELVYDEKLVPEEQVSPRLLALLNKPSAA